MRKLLFTLYAATIGTLTVNGQARLSLYEEFSGENSELCATHNPGLQTLLGTNTNKIMLIRYQSPIPYAGPIYDAYKTVADARLSYYSVPFAPYGVQNGNEVTGDISTYTQADINASVANPAQFAISVNHAWNAAGDSITANISISTPSAYTASSANLKLRVALIEHLSYCSAPGNNAEKEFHNVVREMYPDAAGTSIPNTWTATQTQNLIITGKVPERMDKANNEAILVVWIQNDVDKHILQVARSAKVALPVDVALTDCVAPVLACVESLSMGRVTPMATLTNTGSTILTSAAIFSKLGSGNYILSKVWIGSLPPGASTRMITSNWSMTPGNWLGYDSVALPNGAADVNPANNVKVHQITVYKKMQVALPLYSNFEYNDTLRGKWKLFDVDGDGGNWTMIAASGHNNSGYALVYANHFYAPGEVNYAIMPGSTLPTGSKALDFYVAYAQYSNENDKLEVVYSTDCGVTWTILWNQSGADLATHIPVGNNVQFVPAADDWRLKSIDMSSVPTGATVAFRATSDYGNNLYIDDVNLRSGAPTGIRSSVVAAHEVSLFPNPAKESATLRFTLNNNSKVVVSILDAVGRTVSVVTDAPMQQGKQQVTIPTSTLAAGIYNISIRTAEGMSTQRLTVVK